LGLPQFQDKEGRMNSFNTALIHHMQQERVTIAELAKAAGVSADLIKKARTRPNGSMNAEAAARIAAYFGKSVDQFIRREDVDQADELRRLLRLLSEDEKRFLLAQIRGLAAGRDPG
jgi:transcriptional regulator with XRE-family HTH domain